MPKKQPVPLAAGDLLRIRMSMASTPAESYRWHPEKFLPEVLGLQIYEGFTLDFVRELATSWLHMHARELWRQRDSMDVASWCRERRPDLPAWTPGAPIVNTYCLQGGHKLGKSYVVAGLLVWFALVSPVMAGSVYATKIQQARETTWRYVRRLLSAAPRRLAVQRIEEHLYGGFGSPGIRMGGCTVQTQALESTESIQGGHSDVMVHIVEEAEGVENETVFEGIRTMVDGGLGFWILCANPHTSSSPFARLSGPSVRRFSWSCMDHPNVRQGKMLIPGAVSREWIEQKLYGKNAWVREVSAHSVEQHTFSIPWLPNKIFAKLPPWFWRVDGVPPPIGVTSAPVSPGAYRSACARSASGESREARIGVDVGRGGDPGAFALYHRHAISIWQDMQTSDPDDYVAALRELLQELLSQGCQQVEIRVDQGGGYGDHLLTEARKLALRHEFVRGFSVIAFNSNARAQAPHLYADAVTEAYVTLGGMLEHIALLTPSPELEEDLTARKCHWSVKTVRPESGRGAGEPLDVQELEEKKHFISRFRRSPNQGDAMAICVAPASERGWESYGRE